MLNGDLQKKHAFADRGDWMVVSPNVAIYTGESDIEDEANPLFTGCDTAIAALTVDEHTILTALSESLGRPTFGRP